MRDTTPDADRVRLDAIRKLPPNQRLRHALELSESVRAVALAGLRRRHPGCSDLELVEVLLARQLVPPSAAGRPA
jgi:hypothetical protein